MKASIFSECTGDSQSATEVLPEEFVEGVQMLESILGMSVWLLIAREPITEQLYEGYFEQRDAFPESQPIAVLLHSPGGSPEMAYKLASLIRKRCGEYVTLVPKCAKSAATLFALGASRIILERHAELGPLDMQVYREKTGTLGSALNYVQALDQLGQDTERIMYRVAGTLISEGEYPQSSALQFATSFATSFVRPLVDNIDAEKYTEMSRELKVGAEYAVRLLSPKYEKNDAERIARTLVSQYPDHNFIIDVEEANSIIGLDVEESTDEISVAHKKIIPCLDYVTALGRLEAIEK